LAKGSDVVDAVGRQPVSEYIRLKMAKDSAARTGIGDLPMRQGRTTFATLIEGDTKDTSEMLGHSDVEMTNKHYKKAVPPRQLLAVTNLERKLGRPALKIVGREG
jgi:integrase